MKYLLLKLVVINLLNAFGQLSLKLGADDVTISPSLFVNPQRLLNSPFLLLGGGLYASSLLLYVSVLSQTRLSIAYPFIGLTYVFVVVLSVVVLDEPVTLRLLAGSILIFAGVSLVGMSLDGSG